MESRPPPIGFALASIEVLLFSSEDASFYCLSLSCLLVHVEKKLQADHSLRLQMRRDGHQSLEFPTPSDAINEITLHPRVLVAASQLLQPICVRLRPIRRGGERRISTPERDPSTIDRAPSFSPERVKNTTSGTSLTYAYLPVVLKTQLVLPIRFDLEKIWMIMGPGMYMETKVGQGGDRAPDVNLVSREIVGSETVNGMETTKYKSVYESKDGKFGGFTWYTDDNIAVKALLVHQSKGEKQRIKFELRNLERAAQPDSLFEVPKGARKFDLNNIPGMPDMSEMMKRGAGGRPGQGMPGMPGMPRH